MQTNPKCYRCGNVAYRKSKARGGRRRGYGCKRCGGTFWPITSGRMEAELRAGGVGEKRLRADVKRLVTSGLR